MEKNLSCHVCFFKNAFISFWFFFQKNNNKEQSIEESKPISALREADIPNKFVFFLKKKSIFVFVFKNSSSIIKNNFKESNLRMKKDRKHKKKRKN